MKPAEIPLPQGPVKRPENEEIRQWVEYYVYREVLGSGSKHTERAKIRDLKLFVGFTENKQISTISQWTKGITYEFVNKAFQIYSVSTVNRMLATLSGFAQFLEKSRIISYDDNPVRKVKGPKREPLQPQGIRAVNYRTGEVIETGESVFKKMLETAISLKDKYALRNTAIISTLYYTGMRVDELTSLKLSQLDFNINSHGGWIRGVKCKGNKIRDVFINDGAKKILTMYLENSKPKNYVFPTRSGKKMSQSDVWRIVKNIAVLTSQKYYSSYVTVKVHPHSFRHERAYNLLRKTNMGDSFVAEQLGHSSTNYVSRYTKRTEREIAEILKDV